MTYKVVVSHEAQIELATTECYFRSKNLAVEFLEDFLHQISFLEKTPTSFETKYRNIKIILFEHFNFSIHFVIENDQVIILRILNQRQNY